MLLPAGRPWADAAERRRARPALPRVSCHGLCPSCLCSTAVLAGVCGYWLLKRDSNTAGGGCATRFWEGLAYSSHLNLDALRSLSACAPAPLRMTTWLHYRRKQCNSTPATVSALPCLCSTAVLAVVCGYWLLQTRFKHNRGRLHPSARKTGAPGTPGCATRFWEGLAYSSHLNLDSLRSLSACAPVSLRMTGWLHYRRKQCYPTPAMTSALSMLVWHSRPRLCSYSSSSHSHL